jgi:hypothetical protein
MPHTVLRTFGAHSNSPVEKAKPAILRLSDELTATPATPLQAPHQIAEIPPGGNINDSENQQLIHILRTKKCPETGHFVSVTVVAYKL